MSLFNEDDKKKIIEYYEAGYNDYQIADFMYCSRTCIRSFRIRAGLPTKQAKKLTDAEEARRYKMHESGMTNSEMAALIGITKEAVNSWRRARNLPLNIK